MIRKIFGFTATPDRYSEICLTKCLDCGAYFLDSDKVGSCCKKKERTPIKIMHSNLMQFLLDRRR